jgi:hypothetical protein
VVFGVSGREKCWKTRRFRVVGCTTGVRFTERAGFLSDFEVISVCDTEYTKQHRDQGKQIPRPRQQGPRAAATGQAKGRFALIAQRRMAGFEFSRIEPFAGSPSE